MRHHGQHPDSILVGTSRVTLVGLRGAIEQVARAGPADREAVVDALLEILSRDNWIPEGEREHYRTALWREVLKSRGEDASAFYAEIPVLVRAQAGPRRDDFVRTVTSVLADFELRPAVSFAPPAGPAREPQLVINDQLVVEGVLRREEIRAAINRSVSGW